MGHLGQIRHRTFQKVEGIVENQGAGVQEEDEGGTRQSNPREEQKVGEGQGRVGGLQHIADRADQELRQKGILEGGRATREDSLVEEDEG